MRNGRAKKLRADLRQVRQDILIKIEEQETSLRAEKKEEIHVGIQEEIQEETTPAHLETIATRMLDELGGGEFRIMLKGEQTLAQRVAELAEEKQRMLHLRW